MKNRYGTLPVGRVYSAQIVASDQSVAEVESIRAKVKYRRESNEAPHAIPMPGARQDGAELHMEDTGIRLG